MAALADFAKRRLATGIGLCESPCRAGVKRTVVLLELKRVMSASREDGLRHGRMAMQGIGGDYASF